jgi:hypothetical protein
MQNSEPDILSAEEQQLYSLRMMSSGSPNQGIHLAISAIKEKQGRIFFYPEPGNAVWKMWWSPGNGTPVMLPIGVCIPMSGQYAAMQFGNTQTTEAISMFKRIPDLSLTQEDAERFNKGWRKSFTVAELCEPFNYSAETNNTDENADAKAAFEKLAQTINNLSSKI